jgi:hypothetical protein
VGVLSTGCTEKDAPASGKPRHVIVMVLDGLALRHFSTGIRPNPSDCSPRIWIASCGWIRCALRLFIGRVDATDDGQLFHRTICKSPQNGASDFANELPAGTETSRRMLSGGRIPHARLIRGKQADTAFGSNRGFDRFIYHGHMRAVQALITTTRHG